MKLKINYTLILEEKEAKALKLLLGNMSDPEFAKAGIKGEDRAIIREIYYTLQQIENE